MSRLAGPRPLAAYLTAAITNALQAAALAPKAADARFPWRDDLRAEAQMLAQILQTNEEHAVRAAVGSAAAQDVRGLLKGVKAYRGAPPHTPPPQAPTLWVCGSAKLLDYAPGVRNAPVLLVLPSLINRARILDLTPTHSLMRALAARGLRPLLLDWGAPGAQERDYDLTAYLTRLALPALRAAQSASNGPIAVLGHCMAGPLAMAMARDAAADISGVILLAAPWRFEPDPALHAIKPTILELLNACEEAFGGAPPDLLNAMFFLRDPLQALRKFPSFAQQAEGSAKRELFIAVESWLNDGVLLAGPTAKEALIGWVLEDALARGAWRINGAPLRPNAIRAPMLAIGSYSDTIAPAPNVFALAQAAPGLETLEVKGGHIGMLIGRKAPQNLWEPIAQWVNLVNK